MEVRENGPWQVAKWGGDRVVLQSDDFYHDAALEVTGDFGGSEETKLHYAELICGRLNTVGAKSDFDVLAEGYCGSASVRAKLQWISLALTDAEMCERRIAHHSQIGWLGKSGAFARVISRMIQSM